MANQTYQLVVRTGPQPNQIYALELDVITIGRDPLSNFVIDDPEVSRHHAKLTREAGGYTLQDMGSTNGTFVDGQRLTGAASSLKPGQVLMLGGNVTLVYQVIAEPDPMATVVAPAAELSIEAEDEEKEIEELVGEDILLAAADIPEEEEAISELEKPELIEEASEVIVESSKGEVHAEDVPEEEELEEELEIAESATILEVEEKVVDIEEPEAVPTADDEDYAATMIDAVPPAGQAELSKEEIAPDATDSEAESEVIEPAWEVNETDIVEEPSAAKKPELAAEEVEQVVSQEEMVEELPPAAPVSPMPDYSLKDDATIADVPKKEEAQIIDSGEPLPAFEYETQPPGKETQIVGEKEKRSQSNRNRNIIIAIAAILLLICCCLILLGLIGYLVLLPVNF